MKMDCREEFVEYPARDQATSVRRLKVYCSSSKKMERSSESPRGNNPSHKKEAQKNETIHKAVQVFI